MDKPTRLNGSDKWLLDDAKRWWYVVRVIMTSNTVATMVPNFRYRLLESRVTRKSVKRGSEGGGWKSAKYPQDTR